MLKYCHTCHYRISKPKVLRFVIFLQFLARGRRISPSAHKFLLQDLQKNKERNILWILQYSTIRYPMKLCALCFPKGAWTPGEWGKSPLPCLFFHHKLKSRPLCRLSSFSCLIFLERESSLFHLVIKKRA